MGQSDHERLIFVGDGPREVSTGLDVSGYIRIRLEYSKEDRTIHATWSAASPFDNEPAVREEVRLYIARLRRLLGYAEAWLLQLRVDRGEMTARGGEEG